MSCIKITKASSIPSSYSAEVIANNQDLLTEILLRLPIKSLLIFKYVSKHWLSLISNPNFSRRNTPYPNPASGLFLQTPNTVQRMHNPEYDFISLNQSSSNPSKSPFRSLNFVHDRYGIQILQSCNGLLLCSSFDARAQRRVNYYVYNPTTKQCTKLPQLKAQNGNIGIILGINLAFDDHSMSPHYKAICIRRLNFAQYEIDYVHCQIEIYSSKTGPWRHSGRSFSVAFDTEFHHGVYWKSSIHWLSASKNSLYYYHIDEERASEMPLPHIPNVGERRFEYFGESEGHLQLIETYKNTGTTLYVYEMDRDYRGWIAKFCVDLGEVSIAFPDMFQGDLELTQLHNYVFLIIYVVQGEIDEDSYLVLRIPKKVVQYYFKTKAVKKLYDIDENVCTESSLIIGWNYVYPYIESLACV